MTTTLIFYDEGHSFQGFFSFVKIDKLGRGETKEILEIEPEQEKLDSV